MMDGLICSLLSPNILLIVVSFRPLSQPAPFGLHHAPSSDADPSSGDSISLARSISKDSLASNIVNITPKQQLPSAPVKSSGKSLLNNVEIEDEEEELIAIIRPGPTPNHGGLELQCAPPARSPGFVGTAWTPKSPSEATESKQESFFLEPLMPAVLRPAKEKQVTNKEDECGEGKARGYVPKRVSEGHAALARKKANGDHSLNRTFNLGSSSELTVIASPSLAEPLVHHSDVRMESFCPQASSSLEVSSQERASAGFFLHAAKAEEAASSGHVTNLSYLKSPSSHRAETSWTMVRQDSDSSILDMEEAEQDVAAEEHPLIAKYIGEEESAKLQEDMKVKEHEDKDDASGRSSPCLSTISQVSSVSMTSGSARMTSFAERKLQRLNSYETKSSTSSSQKTTPDGSECCLAPLTTWKQRREQSPPRQSKDNANLLASELVQLHMQLEEKRRAIEAQKKKVEALSARQRLKLGKAAFLHVVKKGKGPEISPSPKPEHFAKEFSGHNGEGLEEDTLSAKTEAFLTKEEVAVVGDDEIPRGKVQETVGFVEESISREPTLHEIEKSKRVSVALLEENIDSADLNECDLSIEKLNETISTLQQAILKISQQQELLMKAPTLSSTRGGSQDQKIKAPVHFVEPLSPPGTNNLRKPPRLGQGRSARSGRPSELKVAKDRPHTTPRIKTPTPSVDTLPHLRQFPSNHSPKTPVETALENNLGPGSAPQEKLPFESYRLCDDNQRGAFVFSSSRDTNVLSEALKDENSNVEDFHPLARFDASGKENISVEEPSKGKGSLIEVDLSDLKIHDEEVEIQGNASDLINEMDSKSGFGFFFKDEQKAEDELAKKRAAFLLKQQRKAEETRLRKQQLEVEVEQKRDEARRKAEEDRLRKEEEKARRELIKQEYLRRKQQQILEEQGLGKPRPKAKKPRPKSVHREESYSDSGTKYSSTPDNLSSAQSGSSLSLASAATTEPESIHSGGTPSQRVESMESLPILSRNPSRNMERDWENTSTASSIASVAEYTGTLSFSWTLKSLPFCLQELEKSEANHYIILFRDAGCQFRALYCYHPDTEEIYKLTGTGPKNITKKMIDKLYKYSSDRKQFNLIPAKTMSVSVDALTIHNHLWQSKRPAVPKKIQNRK
ncbi:PREDICTED: calmodulin-regulated spectrin-associated protein 1 [Thamnophis sirtalis]|uniref:Calmodulin-regulated spectrin-associated protein 1 n=1 Tax=Thamnophis sirtalis TaxID=35019 RepID=A0A6I9XZM2_9SAUR|nr:PREDICTED: calmodulin-regulated spectrin-associated protein 1 [Thamnophis sirtalis]